MQGNVEKNLLERIRQKGAVHLTLLDPEKVDVKAGAEVAAFAEKCGTGAMMVGGSTATSTQHLDSLIREIKVNVKIPVILFPNDITGISRYADAIFFMSLLNSSNPYYIVGAQALGAPLVKKYGLEPIPLAYLILGESLTSVGYIGYAHPIPFSKPELASMYALAAQHLGMRFIYLEAGSGAEKPVPPNVIKVVSSTVDVPVIVGGGIRSPKDARRAVEAGAKVVVTGTVVEEASSGKVRKLIQSVGKA